MPYSEHPAVEDARNDRLRVWRYTNLAKFLSLLQESELFFPRLSELADPLEGFLSKPSVERFKRVPSELPAERQAELRSVVANNLRLFRRARQLTFVSSWHLNQHESAAMWRLYLQSEEGIAIQSTVGRLKNGFMSAPQDVHVGVVKYVDYRSARIPWHNALYLALHKRKSFQHERELRALVFGVYRGRGVRVPVALPTLIENVFIAPKSPRWLHRLIRRVVAKYGLNVPVVHSSLEEKPVY